MAEKIFVTGFIGSDRIGKAKAIAEEHGFKFVDLEEEITAKDGRTADRIFKLMGEHEYRNKEYELICMITGTDHTPIPGGNEDYVLPVDPSDDVVIACSDGILLDEMCEVVLSKNTIVIADMEKPLRQLFKQADQDPTCHYAFMKDPDPVRRFENYNSVYIKRRKIYSKYL